MWFKSKSLTRAEFQCKLQTKLSKKSTELFCNFRFFTAVIISIKRMVLYKDRQFEQCKLMPRNTANIAALLQSMNSGDRFCGILALSFSFCIQNLNRSQPHMSSSELASSLHPGILDSVVVLLWLCLSSLWSLNKLHYLPKIFRKYRKLWLALAWCSGTRQDYRPALLSHRSVLL